MTLRDTINGMRRNPRDWSNSDEADAYNSALDDVLAAMGDEPAIVKPDYSEYNRGVNAMAYSMYRHFGSISEMELHEEHNDAVFAARTKSLANADGKLNMNLTQSEEYVEAIREQIRADLAPTNNTALVSPAKAYELLCAWSERGDLTCVHLANLSRDIAALSQLASPQPTMEVLRSIYCPKCGAQQPMPTDRPCPDCAALARGSEKTNDR